MSGRGRTPNRANDFHRATLDSLEACVAVLDGNGTTIAVNAALDRFARAQPGCGLQLGANYLAACEARGAAGDRDRAAVATSLRDMLAGEVEGFTSRYALGRDGQRPRWFDVHATSFRGSGPGRIVLEHYDSTARVEAERSTHQRTSLLEDIDAAVFACDMRGTIEVWSRGAEHVYGWAAEEVVGRDVTTVILPPDHQLSVETAIEELRGTGSRFTELELRRKDGSAFYGYVSSVVARDERGTASGIVSVTVDVTERVRAAQELRTARDHLRAVTDSMGEALCTLDDAGHISYVNQAAERLLGWSAGELCGRNLHETTHYRRPDGAPYPVDECPLYGGHRAREAVRVDDDMFIRRDGTGVPVARVLTPFQSAAGSSSVIVFTDNTQARAAQERLRYEIEHLSQVRDLHEALQEQRFELFAQPIIDLRTDAIASHELLLRMRERDGSIRTPGSFLPAAERCGLIGELDRWVIGQAARLAGEGHHVELNVLAASLADPGLFDALADPVAEHGADPSRMVVELTETAIMQNETIARTFIERVGALGCELALDDFGTGFGGFGYLKQLPVDYLKIDVEFVRDLRTNMASRHVVEAVVGLARAFGHRTVAEGVEDGQTLRMIRDMGVDLAQGYVIGRPAPLDDTLYSAA